MAITLKTPEDLEGMRVAGKLAAEVLAMLKEHVRSEERRVGKECSS